MLSRLSSAPAFHPPKSASSVATVTMAPWPMMRPGPRKGRRSAPWRVAALGVIAIPGIGPLVAAGVLATTLVGAAGGTLVGGLVGALTDYGVSEEDAHVYSEGVRRGGTLVTVRADDARAAEAERILNQQRPVDINARRAYYADAGWSAYDPKSTGYTAEQIRKERETHGQLS
jgi:hypothetical protein